MKLLLLLTLGVGLAWTLQEQSQVPVQPGFNPKQVAVPWVTLNLASTDWSVIEDEGAYECFMTGIALLDNGNLNVTYFHRAQTLEDPDDTDPLDCSLEDAQPPEFPVGDPGNFTGSSLLGMAQEGYFPLRKDGKCMKEFYVAEETDVPGRYTFEYQGKNYLTFVAVTEEFIIMDLENQREENTLIVVELHGVMTLPDFNSHKTQCWDKDWVQCHIAGVL
ncbi:hypothetical protein HispidOSU_014950, partial [Sigmodon hispidus]